MRVVDEILFDINETNSKRNIAFKRRSPSDGNKNDCAKMEGSKIGLFNIAPGKGLFNHTKRIKMSPKMIKKALLPFFLLPTLRKQVNTTNKRLPIKMKNGKTDRNCGYKSEILKL